LYLVHHMQPTEKARSFFVGVSDDEEREPPEHDFWRLPNLFNRRMIRLQAGCVFLRPA